METQSSNEENVVDKQESASSDRRDFLRKAAIVTAAGAAGVLAVQPLAAKFVPRSEAADGSALIIGASNSGSTPTGNETTLSAHVPSVPAFEVINDAGGGAIEGDSSQSSAIIGMTTASSSSAAGVLAQNKGGGPALLAQSQSFLTAKFQNNGFAIDKTALVQFGTGDTVPVDWNEGVGGSGYGLGLTSGQFYVEQVGHGARMVINNTGRVGIGTNTPNAKLSFGTVFPEDKIFLLDGTADKYGFGIASSELRMFHGAGFTTNHTSFGKYDGTTFTEFMRLTNQGQLGIGTNTPNAKLSFGPLIGDSVFLFDGTNNKYGLGIRASELRIFHGTDLPTNHTSFGKYDGTNFTEFMRLTNQGQQGLGTIAPATTLQVNGSVSAKIATVTSNHTVTTSDFAIIADATAGALTITLPPASTSGMIVHVKKKDISTNVVTVSRQGSDTIEGSVSKLLSKRFKSLTLIADGTNTWYIISNAK